MNHDIWEKYRDLIQNFISKINERRRDIQTSMAGALAGSLADEEFANLIQSVHTLSGSSATFGFSSLGKVARNLEILLQLMVREKPPWTNAVRVHAEYAFDRLLQALEETTNTRVEAAMESLQANDKEATVKSDPVMICCQEAGSQFPAEFFSGQFGLYGLSSLVYPDEKVKLQQYSYRRLYILTSLSPASRSNIEEIRELGGKKHCMCEVIFFTPRQDWQIGLATLATPGSQYLPLSSSASAVVALLAGEFSGEPFLELRVLLYSPSRILAGFYAGHLELENIEVQTINDMEELEQSIRQKNPDCLVLEDSDSEENLLPLARLLSRKNSPESFPVVLLSGRENKPEGDTPLLMQLIRTPADPYSVTQSCLKLSQEHREMRKLASIDPLSRVLLSGEFCFRLERERANAAALDISMHIAAFRLTNLNQIYLEQGKNCGDNLVRCFGTYLLRQVRLPERVGRHSHTLFFALFLRKTDESMQRIIQELKSGWSGIEHRNQSGTVFISAMQTSVHHMQKGYTTDGFLDKFNDNPAGKDEV